MATVEAMIQRLCAANWTIQLHTDGMDGSGQYVVTGYPLGHDGDCWDFAQGDTLSEALAEFAATALGDEAARQEQGR